MINWSYITSLKTYVLLHIWSICCRLFHFCNVFKMWRIYKFGIFISFNLKIIILCLCVCAFSSCSSSFSRDALLLRLPEISFCAAFSHSHASHLHSPPLFLHYEAPYSQWDGFDGRGDLREFQRLFFEPLSPRSCGSSPTQSPPCRSSPPPSTMSLSSSRWSSLIIIADFFIFLAQYLVCLGVPQCAHDPSSSLSLKCIGVLLWFGWVEFLLLLRYWFSLNIFWWHNITTLNIIFAIFAIFTLWQYLPHRIGPIHHLGRPRSWYRHHCQQILYNLGPCNGYRCSLHHHHYHHHQQHHNQHHHHRPLPW